MAISMVFIWLVRMIHVITILRYVTIAVGSVRYGIMPQRASAGGMIWILVVLPCSKVHSAGIGHTIIWLI
jgi:hypothetical protein